MIKESEKQFIEKFVCRESLKTNDPYDIWKTKLGIGVKKFYYSNPKLGIIPAAVFTIYDHYINNFIRIGYKKQEYPIVRAQATLALLNLYNKTNNETYLGQARKHIDWLLSNSSRNYGGFCWGTGFEIVIGKNLVYDKEIHFTTNTIYVLEALDEYYKVTKEASILNVIKSIYEFYEKDIIVIYEDHKILITSYGPIKDRVVTNAVSYTMFAYSIFYNYIDEKEYIKKKVNKMFQFIISVQNEDGSWLYAPHDDNSFIDCFHSCFVLKNIYKSNLIIKLDGSEELVKLGYQFIKNSSYDKNSGLYKRFVKANKSSIIKFDLYDNAELVYLAKLLDDFELVQSLMKSIRSSFIVNDEIYSALDLFGFKRNKNTLRWAVLPYVLAMSK